MSFKQLSSNITQHLEERRQNISDNPRSVNYILLKLDNYVDIIYRELQESFPLAHPGVIQQIENSLTRPRQREIDQLETSISIKNKLVRIVNELENELRGFERECGSFYFDSVAFRRYKHNAVTLLNREYDFLFDGTCLQSIISELNKEHRNIERTFSSNTRNLRSIYQSFKSESVISDFKAKAEREFFKKVDEIIAEYQEYLSAFLRLYEEKWAPATLSVPPEVEKPVMTREMSELEEELPRQQSDSGFDSDYLFPKELEQEGKEDNGEESVRLKEEKSNPGHIRTLTVTFTNGETREFSLSTDQEELQGELERLLLKL